MRHTGGMRPLGLAFAILPCLAHAQLTLSEAERLAKTQNPIIKAAAAGVEAARAARGMMLAPYLPMASLSLYGGRREGETMDMGWGFDMLDGYGSGGNAMLSWRVFSGGQDAAARGAASREVAMAESRARMAWLDLQLEVRTEFAEGLRMQEEVAAAEAALEAAKELEQITEQQVESGKLPQAFVFGAKADRLKAERALARAKADLEGAFARIVACCGADIVGGRLGDWDVPMDVPESLDDALKIANATSPDVRMLEDERRAWLHRAKMADGSGLPQVDLVAAGDRVFKGAPMGDRGSQFGVFVSFPLGDGGMRRSQAAEARKRAAEAEAKAEVAKNAIRAELTGAWAQWNASGAGIEAATGQFAAADEGYRVAKLRYESGKAVRAEVAQALADLKEALVGRAEAAEYQRKAWSRVRRAMGG